MYEPHSNLLKDVLRGAAALVAALVVLVLVFRFWPSLAELAHSAGGRPYLRMINHFVMIILGLSLGAVVMLVCSRRDLVTPAIIAAVLFGLGILGTLMIMVETDDRVDVAYTIIDNAIALLSYVLIVAGVTVARRRQRRLESPR